MAATSASFSAWILALSLIVSSSFLTTYNIHGIRERERERNIHFVVLLPPWEMSFVVRLPHNSCGHVRGYEAWLHWRIKWINNRLFVFWGGRGEPTGWTWWWCLCSIYYNLLAKLRPRPHPGCQSHRYRLVAGNGMNRTDWSLFHCVSTQFTVRSIPWWILSKIQVLSAYGGR